MDLRSFLEAKVLFLKVCSMIAIFKKMQNLQQFKRLNSHKNF